MTSWNLNDQARAMEIDIALDQALECIHPSLADEVNAMASQSLPTDMYSFL